MPIKYDHVFYTYSAKTPFATDAIKDINLEIQDHTFTAIVGQTGSGKSTLIQQITALLLPTSGEIKVDDFLITPKKRKNKNIHELRKHVGIVFQFPEYQLFEETVEKDVAFGPINFGKKESEALKLAHDALRLVGLNDSYFKRSPFDLSGGEKRRVAFAGMLAINPDILILDEPTAGLDPLGAKAIMSLVEKLYNDGKSIILVTHDMDLVLKYAKELIVMYDGNIVAQGKPIEVFQSLDDNSHIDIPQVFDIVKMLKEKGLNLDSTKIKDIDELVEEIVLLKGAKND